MPATRDGDVPALSRWGATVWRLVVSTVGTCLRNRVTGLAAEAAFFALLSLPPLIFGLTGSIGWVVQNFTDQRVGEFKGEVVRLASKLFTDNTVRDIIVPTMDDVLRTPRYDVASIGFILALWSGSRALNVFIDTITVMQLGEVLVQGRPEAIRGDERVRHAYLGSMITGGKA